jgi:hypothetical protein
LTISVERVQAARAIPGVQLTVAELIREYPELADDLMAMTAWRDVNQPDGRDTSFYKKWPWMRPDPYVGPW